MAESLGRAVLDLETDNTGLSSGMKDGERSVSKSTGVMKGLVAGFAAKLSAEMVGATFTLGAELQSLDRKISTVFEDSVGTATEWADANAASMGLTQTEALGLAASFADLLKPMGFTAEEATAMSTDVNSLSGALSNWSAGKKTAAEVSEILAKAMLGEREGLKTLGISITEADVQARLLANGTDELTGAALQQAKAIATQQLITEKSVDAQNAWADAQDDMGVKLNKLKAGLGTVKERIVSGLIPAMEAVLEAGEWVAANWDKVKVGLIALGAVAVPILVAMGVQATISAVKQVAAYVMTGAAAIASGVATAASIAGQIAKWALLGVQSLLHAAKVAAAWLIAMGPIALVIAAVIAVVALIVANWDTIKEVIAAGWEFVKEKTAVFWDWLKGIFKAGLDALVSLLLGWSGASWIIKHWDTIKAAWSAGVEFVKRALKVAVDWLTTLIRDWSIPGLIIKHWDSIKAAFQAGVDFVKELVQRGFAVVTGVFDGVRDSIESVVAKFASMRDRVKDIVGGLVSFISDKFDKAKELMNKLNPWAKSSPSLVENVQTGVKAMASEFGQLEHIDLALPSVAGVVAGLGGANLGLDVTGQVGSLQGLSMGPATGSGIHLEIHNPTHRGDIQDDVQEGLLMAGTSGLVERGAGL